VAGSIRADDPLPLWVVFACYGTISLGTLFGGWRIVKTMGSGITRLQPVGCEWEDEPQPRAVRLVSGSARVDDSVRVTVAGVEVEGRIEAVESSTLRVRVGRRLF